ncbi:M23 family metallopeptidase [Uliginosibacterium sp. H3]|uniref:M23 family metallopeptidase n=1 Tax=Uliginosibacterium silvisoli TaxID=3114758 RepID=A0ABU6K7U9_9RHOO|nr:M23 family metallopeptidase [Uliginosibacterium sp. H3]
MALLLLSNRSISRAGVRAVSMRDVVSVSVIACAVVGCLAFAAGLAIGKLSADNEPRLAADMASDPVRDGFAMQRLGEISARMVTLEGNATSLLKKLTGIEQIQTGLNKLNKAGIAPRLESLPKINEAPKDAAGGPELAPVCDVRAAHTVSPAPTLENVKQAEGALSCLQSLIDRIEQSTASRSVALMALPAHKPVGSVELGSPFGNRVDPITGHIAFHPGLDFAAPMGTEILAAGGGKVRFAGFQSELGNLVEIDHGNGLVSRYAHASRLYVKEGDIVAPGQRISAVGSTGRSTGPHLHFEILHEGRYVDPMQYLTGLSRDGNASPKS